MLFKIQERVLHSSIEHQRLLEEIIKDKDVRVIVKSLDESCITLETRAWVANDKYWDTRFELLEEYKKIFDENGIEIPFNQLDVHITK